MKNFLISALMLVALTGCPDDDEDMAAPQSVADKALQIVSGTVTGSEVEDEEGVAAWKVEIRTAQGAEVEVYCRQDNNQLLRIDGESGPFDYNATPGNGLIDFSSAQSIGAGQTTETLIEWELEQEDKFNNAWVYSLEYLTAEIYIDASDGSILTN
jgi:uncharacterized membrane protein YkoI